MTPTPLALLGPTASGKSALALQLAARLDGEIISCDAMQVYRGCDIVTAKPSSAELKQVPHHLVDVCDPDQTPSAAGWARAARGIIEDIVARGRVPIVCGGTGFYARALLQPDKLGAPAPDEALRAQLEAQLAREGAPALLRQLEALAPDVAARLEAGDRYRVVRALQIALQRARGDAVDAPAPVEARVYALGWPRELLYGRINARVDAMLEAGALGETRALLGRWGRAAPWASGVGYKQLIEAIEDGRPLDEAVEEWKRASRRYAKRQETWFRHQVMARELDGRRGATALADEVVGWAR